MFWKRKPKRVVFTYHNGITKVVSDPLVVLRSLEKHGGEHWAELVKEAGRKPESGRFAVTVAGAEDAAKKKQSKALQDVAELARKVFLLQPLGETGQGLTEAEQIGVLSQYLLFCGGLAESAAPFANSPPPASPSASSTTASSSASCSSVGGSEPTLLPFTPTR